MIFSVDFVTFSYEKTRFTKFEYFQEINSAKNRDTYVKARHKKERCSTPIRG